MKNQFRPLPLTILCTLLALPVAAIDVAAQAAGAATGPAPAAAFPLLGTPAQASTAPQPFAVERAATTPGAATPAAAEPGEEPAQPAEPGAVEPDGIAVDSELAGAGDSAPAAPAPDAADFLAGWRNGRLFGYSGRLRATIISIEEAAAVEDPSSGTLAQWVPMFAAGGPSVLGEPVRVEALPSPSAPGIYLVEYGVDELQVARAIPLAVIAAVPFERKEQGYLNGYHIGRYPVEGSGRTDRYAPPAGFIEVTPQNQDFRVSEHFRLRQFLTKDQDSIWPKYLALDLRLVDKLELVLQELNAMGIRAEAMHVMSGFRTPQYNGPGGDGRATLSRHTYGDAADVWVDSDGDGYMDDLNGDGRVDIQDARVMLRAVERVERRFPELVGGAGVYVATSAHGPFIHIDVRGSHARW